MTPPELADVRLRLATRSDEQRVEALLTAAQLPLDGVHEALDCFVVAEAAGELVGVAGLEACGRPTGADTPPSGGNALLRSVAVHADWRSKGLGRALVTQALALAEQRGVNALYLLTTTADRYFPSFGFHQIPREAVPADVQATKEFAEACPASAVVMVREAR